MPTRTTPQTMPAPASSGPGRPPSASARPAIHTLTGLRFPAALWVIFFHYGLVFRYPPLLRQVFQRGDIGLTLFFILSGFVLVYNYSDWFENSLGQVPAFLRARFARIVPMYLVTFLLMTPMTLSLRHGPLTWSGGVSGKILGVSWLSNLLFLQAYLPKQIFHIWNRPSWSVSAELSFYFAFPFFVRYVLMGFLRRGWIVYLIGLLLLVQALGFAGSEYYLHSHYDHYRFIYYTVFFDYLPYLRIWEFFLGCCVGLIFLQAPHLDWLPIECLRRSALLRNAVLSLAIFAMVVIAIVIQKVLGDGEAVRAAEWYVPFTPPSMLIIAMLAFGPTWLGRLLEWRPIVMLGDASYSLYLTHWIPFTLLVTAVAAGYHIPAAAILLVIAPSIPASYACYRLIEVPARRRLRGGLLPSRLLPRFWRQGELVPPAGRTTSRS